MAGGSETGEGRVQGGRAAGEVRQPIALGEERLCPAGAQPLSEELQRDVVVAAPGLVGARHEIGAARSLDRVALDQVGVEEPRQAPVEGLQVFRRRGLRRGDARRGAALRLTITPDLAARGRCRPPRRQRVGLQLRDRGFSARDRAQPAELVLEPPQAPVEPLRLLQLRKGWLGGPAVGRLERAELAREHLHPGLHLPRLQHQRGEPPLGRQQGG